MENNYEYDHNSFGKTSNKRLLKMSTPDVSKTFLKISSRSIFLIFQKKTTFSFTYLFLAFLYLVTTFSWFNYLLCSENQNTKVKDLYATMVLKNHIHSIC